jgi:hypothetical protein
MIWKHGRNNNLGNPGHGKIILKWIFMEHDEEMEWMHVA